MLHTSRDAICTAVSRNYLPFARVLCASFKRFHPDASCYVALVDGVGPECRDDEPFELIPVTDLGIQGFLSVAFKYDILELNTGIKPTLFKYLFDVKGVERLVYLDPDIRLFSSMEHVFSSLDEFPILLTPHTLRPIEDDCWPDERNLLRSGAYNLGFIGVANSAVGRDFVSWWEGRCLTLGFNDVWNGYFVDQKWVGLAPCYFEGVHILRHPGCNVAYWNLHERQITEQEGSYFVNSKWPLTFFHFSGVSVAGGESISKHTNRFTLKDRPDLNPLFDQYRAELKVAANKPESIEPYRWGSFSNGQPINKLTRVVYSLREADFVGSDPFDAGGEYYRFAKSNGLLAERESAASFNSMTYNPRDRKLQMIHRGFRLALRWLGADRYTMLMKYLTFISVLRNQGVLFHVKQEVGRELPEQRKIIYPGSDAAMAVVGAAINDKR